MTTDTQIAPGGTVINPAPTAPGRAPAVAVSVLAGLVWLGQTLHFVFAMTTTVPKFEEIFRDFGVALPTLTRWFIAMSREFRAANPGQSFSMVWAVLMLWTLAVLGVTWFCAMRRSIWPGLLFLVLGLIWWGVLGVLLVLALDLPMQSMIQSLQGG